MLPDQNLGGVNLYYLLVSDVKRLRIGCYLPENRSRIF